MTVDFKVRCLLIAWFIPIIIGMTGPENPSALAAQERNPRTEEQVIRIQGERISVDVRNASIRDLLKEIAQKSGIAIGVGDGISGEISIKLTDVSIQEALENLCRNRAFVYEYLPETKAYRIVRALTVGPSKETPPSAAFASGETKESSSIATAGKNAAESRSAAGVMENQGRGREGFKRISGEKDTRGRPLYKKGELLVRFKPEVSRQQIEALHLSLQSKVLREIPKMRLQRIQIRAGLSEQEAMALYEASKIVDHVGRNAFRYPCKTSNDPHIDLQWALAKIKAPEAWDITTGQQEVVIAVIDSGVNYLHSDLKDHIWINSAELNGTTDVDDDEDGYTDDNRGWDFADGDNDPMDIDSHGTHIAGIIAATGNNGLGIAGINWKARIMPLKIQSDDGEMLVSSEIEAVQYAIDHGARIVNCSFGGEDDHDEVVAFRAMKEAGIIAVCAVANDSTDNDTTPTYPASYDIDNIISVAASNLDDELASFSNWGKTGVDLMAPGDEIYSTIPKMEVLVRVTGGDNTVNAVHMEYAPRTEKDGVTGTLYSCGQGYPTEFPDGVRGNIALIQRGTLFFDEKVQNAQNSGAKGVIIYNNVVDDFDETGGTLGWPGDWIPTVTVTQAAGESLKALENPTVTLVDRVILTDSDYGYMSGTSMATPHVAGVAGLLLAQRPSRTYEEIKSAILNSVDKIDSVTDKLVSGGRLNAFAALKSLPLPGDLNGDYQVGLDDAIVALQVLSNLRPALPEPCPECGRTVGGDARIGLKDSIYILQTLAGLR